MQSIGAYVLGVHLNLPDIGASRRWKRRQQFLAT